MNTAKTLKIAALLTLAAFGAASAQTPAPTAGTPAPKTEKKVKKEHKKHHHHKKVADSTKAK